MLLTILLWIVFGLVVGAIARGLMPGRQAMGFARTTMLGIIGSFVGGLLATVFTGGFSAHHGLWHPAGFLGSVLGAVIVLAIAGVSRRRVA